MRHNHMILKYRFFIIFCFALTFLVVSTSNGFATSKPYEEMSSRVLKQVEALMLEGKTLEARNSLLVALAADPANADAFATLGKMSMSDGDYEQAVQSLATAIRIDPTRRDVYVALGRSQLALDNVDGARETIAKLTQLCGDCAQLAILENALALSLSEKGDGSDASPLKQ
jgi:cytochrome c-type biogenesis protein CcmH/NrfG